MGLFPAKSKPIAEKSFWQKKEGTTAKVVIALLIGGGAVLTLHLLPYIIEALKNIWVVIGLSLPLVAVAYIASNKQWRAAISLTLKGWMKRMTGWWIETNPLAILDGYVISLRKKLSRMDDGKTNLTEQLGQLSYKKKKTAEEMSDLQERVMALRKRGQPGDLETSKTLAANYTSREQLLAKYNDLYNRMDFLKSVINKMIFYSQQMIDRISDKVELKREEYLAVKSAHGVISDAMSIIKGGTSEKEIYDRAYDFVGETIETGIAEMEDMLSSMEEFMNTIDLENDVYANKGMERIEQWEAEMSGKLQQNTEVLTLIDSPHKLNEVISNLNQKSVFTARAVPQTTSSGGSKYFSQEKV